MTGFDIRKGFIECCEKPSYGEDDEVLWWQEKQQPHDGYSAKIQEIFLDLCSLLASGNVLAVAVRNEVYVEKRLSHGRRSIVLIVNACYCAVSTVMLLHLLIIRLQKQKR